MKPTHRFRFGEYMVYAVLGAVCLWQGWRIAGHTLRPRLPSGTRFALVTVSGNVERPGRYRVPEGTSQFQLIRVAGVRATSDLSTVDLAELVQHNAEVVVGSLGSPAGLRLGRFIARLEFFIGTVSVRSQDGTTRPYQPGVVLTTGDEVETDSSSQAEVSLGPFTRVDLDRGSRVVFDRIGVREGERTMTALYQKTGTCWYRVVYGSKAERFRVVTAGAIVTPGGNGADFLVESTEGLLRVHGFEGTLMVERPGGEEVLNLAAGQTLTVHGNRPFQVSARPSELSPQERFSNLERTRRTESTEMQAPTNFVFCAVPTAYYFVSLRSDVRAVTVVAIPPETCVDRYAVGLTTLNEAFLVGGGTFVQNLVEQIVSTRVDRYCALDPDGVPRLAQVLGGVKVNVDEKAAKFMGIAPGPHRLSGEQLATFLRPRVSGREDSQNRAQQVLRGLFDEVRTGGLAVTAALAEQAMAVLSSNFTVLEIVDTYKKFAAQNGWTMTWHTLPGEPQRQGKRTVFRHDSDGTRRMMFGG